MPIYANRIVFGADPEVPADYYPFEDMLGRLQPKAEKLEAFIRPGHRGETLRKTGIRAVPSQIVTVHYVFDWDAAAAAITAYQTLIDGNPYNVIQRGTDFGYWRIVEAVELPQTHYVANVIGSILFDETGELPSVCQYVQWTLISTDAPP